MVLLLQLREITRGPKERVLYGIHVRECCDVVVAKTSEASEIEVKHIGWYYY